MKGDIIVANNDNFNVENDGLSDIIRGGDGFGETQEEIDAYAYGDEDEEREHHRMLSCNQSFFILALAQDGLRRDSDEYPFWAIGQVGYLADTIEELDKRLKHMEKLLGLDETENNRQRKIAGLPPRGISGRLDQLEKRAQLPTPIQIQKRLLKLLKEKDEEKYNFAKQVLEVLFGPEETGEIVTKTERTYRKTLAEGDTRDTKQL